MKKLVIVFAIIIVILLGILLFVPAAKGPTHTAMNNVAGLASADGHLLATAPIPNASITSPVTVHGTITGGGWFFEAVFPVKIMDADGTVLGQGQARAESEWTSSGTVPFTATVPFAKPHSETGTIVLAKDNPSGDPANDMTLVIPVSFLIPPPPANRTAPVEGRVQLGPTCPVETNPPTPGCEPKPYQTTVLVYQGTSMTGVALRSFETTASGTFQILLAPGAYILKAVGGSPFPRCGSIQVQVSAAGLSGVVLSCDTGIR